MDTPSEVQSDPPAGESFQAVEPGSDLPESNWQGISLPEHEENWTFDEKQEQVNVKKEEDEQNPPKEEDCQMADFLEQKEPNENPWQQSTQNESESQDQCQRLSTVGLEQHNHQHMQEEKLHDPQSMGLSQETKPQQPQYTQHEQQNQQQQQEPQQQMQHFSPLLHILPQEQQQQPQQPQQVQTFSPSQQLSQYASQPQQQQLPNPHQPQQLPNPHQQQQSYQQAQQPAKSNQQSQIQLQHSYQHSNSQTSDQQQQQQPQDSIPQQPHSQQSASQQPHPQQPHSQLYAVSQTQQQLQQNYQHPQQQPHSLQHQLHHSPLMQQQLQHSTQQQQQNHLPHQQPPYQPPAHAMHLQQLPTTQHQTPQQLQQAAPYQQSHQQHQLSQQKISRNLQQQQQRQPHLQHLTSQPLPQPAMGQIPNSTKKPNMFGHSISFGSLLPIILPQISKEQSHQIQQLYSRLRRNEVSKEDFLRATRTIVGDQMLVNAVRQVQKESSQNPQQQQQQHFQLPPQQASSHQSLHQQQSSESQTLSQISAVNIQQTQRPDYQLYQQSTTTTLPFSHSTSDSNPQIRTQAGEQHLDPSSINQNQNNATNLHQVKQEVDKTMTVRNQQQQQMQSGQSPYTVFGRSHSTYASQPISTSLGMPQPNVTRPAIQDSQMRQPGHQHVGLQPQGMPSHISNIKSTKSLQNGVTSQLPTSYHQALPEQPKKLESSIPTTVVIKQEVKDNFDQQTKGHSTQANTENIFALKTNVDQGQPFAQQQIMASTNALSVGQPASSAGMHPEHTMQGQGRLQVPSTPNVVTNSQNKTPTKKSSGGQKKTNEATGSSAQPASKKQKTSGGFPDQSIDQLNDVTAVSGVNLREEEEQLFAGPKEESHASEAMRKFVQEEEEKMFLEKGPLHTRLAGIMARNGIKNISTDTERCLSLGVEERFRSILLQMIKLSKQRVDAEKNRHKIAVTSDVRSQILLANKRAKEEWERKQAEEAEKLRKTMEVENTAENDKEENRPKAQKANKEEEDKMRATAANVAARAAIGGDDVLSKWQMMAEKARQTREGVTDSGSNARGNKETKRKSLDTSKASGSENLDMERKGDKFAGMARRTIGTSSQLKSNRVLCMKDLISCLEREPKMTKSAIIYRLYLREVLQNKGSQK